MFTTFNRTLLIWGQLAKSPFVDSSVDKRPVDNSPGDYCIHFFSYNLLVSTRIEKDKIKLEADYEILKAEYAELEARHQKFLQDHLARTIDSSALNLSFNLPDRRGKSVIAGSYRDVDVERLPLPNILACITSKMFLVMLRVRYHWKGFILRYLTMDLLLTLWIWHISGFCIQTLHMYSDYQVYHFGGNDAPRSTLGYHCYVGYRVAWHRLLSARSTIV